VLLSKGETHRIHEGDCITHMADMPAASVDFSIFSPPFPSLFAYTSEPCDIGNVNEIRTEAKLHLAFFYNQLVKVMKPGRVVIVHVAQIPGLLRNGELGTTDFRGLNIRMAQRAGFIYQYDWLVTKNPQAQAIRTHSHKLLFVQLERDRAKNCGAFGDYLIKIIAPGENAVPIDQGSITRQEWIDWAEGCWPWSDIRETDTLNVREARGKDDVKHICPLQLGVIDRCVRLFSNPDDVVFSPFAGIGSEGYIAVKRYRRFYGCEIKREYIDAARRNLKRAEEARADESKGLFSDDLLPVSA